ncbi:hypothetical protein FDP41_007228 [Naegleria fowleri]|uniref:Regulatory protein SIR2 homolog 7 n=1 Tax=Naegleria fowleri TaxID=5763 RepID=A0A6A5BHC2_NAEFO|nr:uncharacterized protein FDP41_007228 [Naegleria fowleri]KAF0973841.1 hypothetical protein FDP41_007228 [Naegleria fowleri]
MQQVHTPSPLHSETEMKEDEDCEHNQPIISAPRTARRKSSSKTTSSLFSEGKQISKKTLNSSSSKKKKASSTTTGATAGVSVVLESNQSPQPTKRKTSKTSHSKKKTSKKKQQDLSSEDDSSDHQLPSKKSSTTPKRSLNDSSSSYQKKKKKKKKEKHYDSDFERNDYDSDVEYEEDIEFLRPKIAQLGDLFAEHKGNICIFSGAGISSSAGLSTYRGKDGIWLRDGMLLSAMSNNGGSSSSNSGNNSTNNNNNTSTSSTATTTNKNLNLKYFPTLTHMAIKKLYDLGYIKYIITQNSDNLHLKSGIDEKDIVEIHGNSYKEYCEKCNKTFTREDIIVHPTSESIYRNIVKSSSGLNIIAASKSPTTSIENDQTNTTTTWTTKNTTSTSTTNKKKIESSTPPTLSIDNSHLSVNKCEYCQSPLKDLIVNFGEKVPQHLWDKAVQFIENSTLILAIGSKLSVDPVNSLVTMNPNSKLIICNLQLTPFNDDAFMVIRCKSDDLFNRLVEKIDPPNRFEIPEYIYEIELNFNPNVKKKEERNSLESETELKEYFQVKSTQLNIIESVQLLFSKKNTMNNGDDETKKTESSMSSFQGTWTTNIAMNIAMTNTTTTTTTHSIKLFNGNQFTYHNYNSSMTPMIIDQMIIQINHKMFTTKFRKLLKSNKTITIPRRIEMTQTTADTTTTTTTTNHDIQSSSTPLLFNDLNDLFKKTIRLKYYTNQNKWNFEVNNKN